MDGAEKRLGAGICSSSGLRSALPITSLMALKSKPACLGRLEVTSPSSASSVGLFTVGVLAVGVFGIGVAGDPSRGGRSSSATLCDDPCR